MIGGGEVPSVRVMFRDASFLGFSLPNTMRGLSGRMLVDSKAFFVAFLGIGSISGANYQPSED